MSKRQCTAIAVTSGERCRKSALAGFDTCYFHTAAYSAARRAASARGGKQKAAREATVMLERVTGELVELDENGKISIDTLEDTKAYVLGRMNDLSTRSSGDGDMSINESKELRGWTVVLLKIQELGGLGAMDRIYQLEQALADYDAQAVKLLPAPEED